MAQTIRKVAVLGAGVMGTGIAAHLAGVGLETVLLDIVPPELTEDDIPFQPDEEGTFFYSSPGCV